MTGRVVGFEVAEIQPGSSTRSARLKWVIVVDAGLPTGRVVNAASCVAGATVQAVSGLLGPDATDEAGSVHPGLPWAGCSVLTGGAQTLQKVRARAVAQPEIYVADMPLAAQETRVYDDYLSQLSSSPAEEILYVAVSLVGPRKQIDRIVGGLKLLP